MILDFIFFLISVSKITFVWMLESIIEQGKRPETAYKKIPSNITIGIEVG